MWGKLDMPRVTLTDRFLAHAKAGASGRAEYFDSGTAGLSLRVSKGGKKAWSFFFTSPKDGHRAQRKGVAEGGSWETGFQKTKCRWG